MEDAALRFISQAMPICFEKLYDAAEVTALRAVTCALFYSQVATTWKEHIHLSVSEIIIIWPGSLCENIRAAISVWRSWIFALLLSRTTTNSSGKFSAK